MARVDLTGVHYRGADISPYLIGILSEPVRSQSFAASTGASVVEYMVLDAVKGPVPSGFDLVLVRDVMGHLNIKDNTHLLVNVFR